MFQRLEKLRKNAFSSMCLFGENNNSTISGIWVWKGHDLVFELSEDWMTDYASYDWKKLEGHKDTGTLLEAVLLLRELSTAKQKPLNNVITG